MVLVSDKPATLLVFDKLNSASERGTKPDAWGRQPCHWSSPLQAAMVNASQAWQAPQPRCMPFLPWQTASASRAPSPRAYGPPTRHAGRVCGWGDHLLRHGSRSTQDDHLGLHTAAPAPASIVGALGRGARPPPPLHRCRRRQSGPHPRCSRPVRPICGALRPARMGWMRSRPEGAMTPSMAERPRTPASRRDAS